MDEYKQLKGSVNKGQDQHVGPQQHVLSDTAIKAQQAAAQKSVPPHQEERQETDPKVVLQ